MRTLNKQLNNNSIQSGALVYRSTTQSVNNAILTSVLWDSEAYDEVEIHSTSTNTNRLTVPSGTRKIRLTARIEWIGNTTGYRTANIYKNGSIGIGDGLRCGHQGVVATSFQSGAVVDELVSPVILVTPGDYFDIKVFQNSGGALSILATSYFSMEIIK